LIKSTNCEHCNGQGCDDCNMTGKMDIEIEECKMKWCDEEELEDYNCHSCHDGMDITEACPLEEWKVTYKIDDGNVDEETLMYQCPDCDVEYYNNFYQGNGSVGGSEWKVLPTGEEIPKHKPRKNDNDVLECNY